MIGNCLENVRKNVPLVHNITNYVTVNDVANVLLACGGSPIMSDEPDDVADITSICGGLNINIGTLNKNSIEGMFIAGKKANELSHKILLDPVGAGASKLRTDTAVKLAKEIKEKYPSKTIWLYTGALWESLQGEEILNYLDVLVDGEFMIEKKNVALKWKGSSNQRVIDVQKSLKEKQIILHAEG